MSQIPQAILAGQSQPETTSDRAAIIAARRSGPIHVDIENRYGYALRKVSAAYCHWCGHDHRERSHSCSDQALCDETEKTNDRDYVNASGSYRRRER